MNLKKIIIILVILLLISIGAMVVIIGLNNKTVTDGNIQSNTVPEVPNQTEKQDTSLKVENDCNRFYAVKGCVEKFYTYYGTMYQSQDNNSLMPEEVKAKQAENKQKHAESLYQMLAPEYISFSGITKENIISKLPKMEIPVINITNMYVSEKTANVFVYIVSGTLRGRQNGELQNFQVMLEVDKINKTFRIYLQDYIREKYKNIKLGNEIEIQVPSGIEKNTYNSYDAKNILEETYVQDLFKKWKEEVLYQSELAYKHIDAEYKNKKFSTIEKFQAYRKNNLRKYVIMELDKYQKTQKDGYTQYACIDKAGNYYIFKETSIMNYTMLLDTYTVDQPEFIEKYEKMTENQKVQANIQKVFDAINLGDYEYMYNKLDQTFKNTYFKTQTEFENYIKKNFFSNNSIGYRDYQKNEEIYLYNIQISNKQGVGTIQKKVVMQLKEGTDFVMSFNVE